MYRIEGFVFETEEQAQAAKKEAAGIRYIRQQVRMDDPDSVLKLYNSLIIKEVFSTPVGIAFLGKLREYLIENPRIRNSDIMPIPAVRMQAATGEDDEYKEKIAREQRELEENRREEIRRNRSLERERIARQGKSYRTKFHVSMFFMVVFAVALAGMFVITALSQDNVTIANYETEILNKYAAWEMELSQKESELKSREAAVQKKEAELGIVYEDTEYE
ncbi:MAG: hypothetical protein LUI02_01755 [Clostridiales bacterium]|nr:hypothetical protein [Clostridiales bacterium]